MKTRNELLTTIGKIEARLDMSQTTLGYIQSKANSWEVNALNNNLARIQELIDEITKEEFYCI